MKTLPTALVAGSLGLNLALIGFFFAGRMSPSETTAVPVVAAVPAAAKTVPALDGHAWIDLQGADLPAMVKRLRDGGFPPDLIRAIMVAQIRDSFSARLNAIDPAAASRAFWKSAMIDPRAQLARNQLYREQRQILRELLGADGEPQENVIAIYQGRRLDSVPADKLDDVRRALRDYEDARSDVFSNLTGGSFSPEMQRKLAAVDKSHQDALAQVLSPAELEAFNLRNSGTARLLRGNLTAFNPTEDEFRSLYRLQADFDGRFGPMYGMPGPDEQRQRGEAQRQLNDQIKAVLGPVRGAEYERATDYYYRQTSQLVSRLELAPDTTTKIWDIKQEVEQRANALRRDTSLAAAERNRQLAALADESASKLSPLLGGTRGLDAFKQYGGSWLQNLTPRPTPGPTTSGSLILSPGR
ncbi:MAG: hypothetical protein EXS37_13080 [Opitutus sp.]|nr:hypothetical protein [Opitutus sp.]